MIFRLFLVIGFLSCPSLALSADQDLSSTKTLSVAVAECPPFVMADNGEYSGLAIYLWEQVGREMGLSWEYSEHSLGGILESIQDMDPANTIDVGISCISVTAEREKHIDFAHSFTETHTAIAARQTSIGSAVTGLLTSPKLWTAFLIILGVAAVIGVVFFLLEHKKNKKLFSTKTAVGRSVETMIIGLLFVTSGPIRFYRFNTLTARILATVLALGSTFLIAAVTAVLASSFTLSSLQSQITNINDLRNLRVGALEASTSSAFLHANNIAHQTRPDLDRLVVDLDQGNLDAIVSDAAFLQYRIRVGQEQGQFRALTVLPLELEAQNYAFVLDQNSPYREEVNRALLAVRMQREWRDMVTKYLGE